MSTEKQETVADILKEMRAFKRYAQSESSDCRYVAYWTYETFPARLEAAWKRERELGAEAAQICGELGEAIGRASGGNAAAMREALEKIASYETPHNFQAERSDIADACYDLTRAIKAAKAALSAPPRNCDVGTAEAQSKRYIDQCVRFRHCKGCPLCGLIENGKCEFAWMQMPYDTAPSTHDLSHGSRSEANDV